MRRRNKNNRKNRKNSMQDTKARLSMENLEPRQMMSASPVYGPLPVSDLTPNNGAVSAIERTSATSGHVAETDLSRLENRPCFKVSVAKKGNLVNINGTSCDDFVEVSQPDSSHVKVTVYEDAERKTVQSSKTYNRSSVDAVIFNGKDGNDHLWNGHLGTNTASIGYFGTVTFPAQVEQHDLRVIGNGGPGNDLLEGGNSTDSLHGNDGDDTLHGNNGGDLLFGDSGNDNLYGGSGTDRLSGGTGLDGMHGGKDYDFLLGGSGADRFLMEEDGDSIGDKSSSDATIHFENGKKKSGSIKNVTVDSDRFDKLKYKLGPGTWSGQNIEHVDQALQALHHLTGNTNLLKRHNAKEMTFVKLGKQTVVDQDGNDVSGIVEVGGFNSGKRIGFAAATFSNQDDLTQTVFHEIGHNWDQCSENSRTEDFRDLSDWKGKTHDASANFARPYGKTNPKEDYATVFAAYMMDKAGLNYNGLSDKDHDALMLTIADKLALIDDLVVSLS